MKDIYAWICVRSVIQKFMPKCLSYLNTLINLSEKCTLDMSVILFHVSKGTTFSQTKWSKNYIWTNSKNICPYPLPSHDVHISFPMQPPTYPPSDYPCYQTHLQFFCQQLVMSIHERSNVFTKSGAMFLQHLFYIIIKPMKIV